MVCCADWIAFVYSKEVIEEICAVLLVFGLKIWIGLKSACHMDWVYLHETLKSIKQRQKSNVNARERINVWMLGTNKKTQIFFYNGRSIFLNLKFKILKTFFLPN